MTNSDFIKDRLTSIMIADRGSGAEKTLRILRSDLFVLLRDYMSLDPDDLTLSVAAVPGGYRLTVTADTERFLEVGGTID